MPITKFQSDVWRLLAAHRSPDSYIGGDVAINREGPRFSADIDVFHDSEARLEIAARTDASVLTAEGYIVVPVMRQGKREATVSRRNETMRLEWASGRRVSLFRDAAGRTVRLRPASRRSRHQ